jgi:hypothetical protein
MNDEKIIAYLLRELTDEEREEVAEQYFADDDLHERMEQVEEDLVAAYVGGTLTPEMRARFERNYLTTTYRRENVVLTAALMDFAQAGKPEIVEEKPTWQESIRAWLAGWARTPQWAGAAAILLVCLGLGMWWRAARQPADETQTPLTLALVAGSGTKGTNPPGQVSRRELGGRPLRLTLTVEPDVTALGYTATFAPGDDKPLPLTRVSDKEWALELPPKSLAAGVYLVSLTAHTNQGAKPVKPGYRFAVTE